MLHLAGFSTGDTLGSHILVLKAFETGNFISRKKSQV
jgi:hypothetical protein